MTEGVTRFDVGYVMYDNEYNGPRLPELYSSYPADICMGNVGTTTCSDADADTATGTGGTAGGIAGADADAGSNANTCADTDKSVSTGVASVGLMGLGVTMYLYSSPSSVC